MKKIWGFCTVVRNQNVKAEYGEQELSTRKYKQVYKDELGMYIKDGKKIIWLTEKEQQYIKEHYQ